MSKRSVRGIAVVATALSLGCGASGSAEGGSGQPAPAVNPGQASAKGNETQATAAAGATITGIAFVDASVTGQGSRATLPAGAKVHPSGAAIAGTEGCPTNRYGTDGLIVAVIDYAGRPTAGSLTITENPSAGMARNRAPYYLDLNSGRTLQFLGPITQNGSYDLKLAYDLAQGTPKTASGRFTLARSCGPVR